MTEDQTPQRLVARLQRLLEARLELVDELETLSVAEDAQPRRDLRERLARLTREQEDLVTELQRAMPPDQPPPGDAQAGGPSPRTRGLTELGRLAVGSIDP